MIRANRVLRTTLAAAGLAAALFTVTACEQAQQAVNCVELTTRITNDVADVQNVLNDPQAASKALDNLDKTLDKATTDVDSQDGKDAVKSMQAQVESFKTALENNQIPDLGPLVSKAGDFVKVCAS